MNAIRRATVADAELLADVHVRTWQTAYRGILSDDFLSSLDEDARTRWWVRFIADGAEVHVADENGVVGFCHADSSGDEGWGEVFSIYVHPDHWGEGHGHALLLAAEQTLLGKGHEKALLWVLAQNERGRRFYVRQGWTLGKPIRVEEIGGVQVSEVRYEKNLSDRA